MTVNKPVDEKTTKCKKCDGSGTAGWYRTYGGAGAIHVSCSSCGGTGEKTVEKKKSS